MAGSNAFASYLNARARGMKSTLLGGSELNSLADASSPDALAELLLGTSYEHEIAEALTDGSGVDAIEAGISRNLFNTFAKLRRLASGRYEEPASVFLARWDLHGVKSLLRNRHHELDAQSGSDSLVPVPSMPVAVYEDLAAQDSMDALVAGLAAWNRRLCGKLLGKLGEYQDSGELRVLEDALDRAYFVDNVSKLGMRDPETKAIAGVLRIEIDRINLRMVFAPRPEGMASEDVLENLLPKGRIDQNVLREIATATSRERAVSLLEQSPYAGLQDALAYFAETGRFSRVDRAFELEFLRRLRSASQQQAIGLPILLRFAWNKYNEVLNLRMIARGLSINMSSELIREELTHV